MTLPSASRGSWWEVEAADVGKVFVELLTGGEVFDGDGVLLGGDDEVRAGGVSK